jgi:uncharacterized protein
MMPFSLKPQTNSSPRPQEVPRAQRIMLGGQTLVPLLSGALWAPDFKTLIVADLHLEQGASLARRGVHVPPYDSVATLTALENTVRQTGPWRLILLGDSFHDAVAHEEIGTDLQGRLLALTGAVETIWLTGNHDPVGPDQLGGCCLQSCQLGEITLRHEPQKLGPGQFEIAGHLHPGATLIQRGIALRGKVFVHDARRLIMPAFGSYTGAFDLRHKAFHGLLNEGETQVTMIGKSALHRFPLARLA